MRFSDNLVRGRDIYADGPVGRNTRSVYAAAGAASVSGERLIDELSENAARVAASGGSLAVGGEVVANGVADVASVETALIQAIQERRSLFHGDLGGQDAEYFNALDRVNQLKVQLTGLTDQPKSDEIYARLVASTPPTVQQ